MKNALSWFLSILFHTAVAVLLLHSVQLEPMFMPELMELDLTQIEEPEPIIPMPVPPPPPPEPMEQPVEETPEELPGAAPLPTNETVVLDDTPPPPPEPEPVVEPEPVPEPEPEAIEISPKKTLPPEEELAEDGLPKTIKIRNDFTAHRGHEARFGRTMMGDFFSYSAREFSGNFKAKDNRTISIIDARNTKYGRFLIYDSKNKTLRRLKQAFGKYVFTIGPSVYADEPIIGTVTFLAKNDRIERFILVTDDDRIAHYPRKVHVREENAVIKSPTGDIPAALSRPPYGEGHAGVVVIHGTQCVNPGLIQGVTRSLSMHNLATLSFSPRGCDTEDGTPGSATELTQDTVAAYGHLAEHEAMDPEAVGIWGSGQGVPIAIQAGIKAQAKFMVCVLTDDLATESLPGKDTLSKLNMPVLWLAVGRKTGRWTSSIKTLEKLRDADGKTFSIIVAPLKASQDVLDAESEQSGWVEEVTEDHASLVESWIRNLKK